MEMRSQVLSLPRTTGRRPFAGLRLGESTFSSSLLSMSHGSQSPLVRMEPLPMSRDGELGLMTASSSTIFPVKSLNSYGWA